MHCFIALRIIIVLLCTVCIAHADTDYILDKAYFEDTSSTMPFQTAKQQPYQTYEGMFVGGYSASAYWIRLHIKGHTQDSDRNNAILRILPSQLDKITLYDEHEKDWIPKTIGDRYPWSWNDYQSVNLNFVITNSEEPRYIYLRIKTSGSNFFNASLIDIKTCHKLDLIQNTYYSIYMAILVIVFIIALSNALITQSKLIIIFASKQGVAVIAMLSYCGYLKVALADTVDAVLLDNITSFFLINYSLFTTLFNYALYHQYPSKKWVIPSLKAMAYTYIAIIFIWIFLSIRHALQLNISSISALSLVMLLIPIKGIDWSSIQHHNTLKKLLITTQSISVVSVLATGGPALGAIGNNSLAPYIVLFHAGITSFMLLLILQYSAKIKADEKLIALTTAQALAESEHQQRMEQGKFIALLAHEFKTPLSILRLAVDSGQLTGKFYTFSTNAIDNMNRLIERCIQIDKLTGDTIPVQMQHVAINTLVQDEITKIIGHRRINHRFGKNLIIETDPLLFKTILSNLLDNAIKYGSTDHTIEVISRTYMAGRHTMLSIVVKNKSLHNRKPDPDMLFKKYYRADFASEKSGTGLGLFLAKSLAVALNGDLRYSSVGDWVLFEIRLPVT